MRITLLTNRDAASALALHYLLPVLSQHIVCVFHTNKPRNPDITPKALQELSDFEQSLVQQHDVFNQAGSKLLNAINKPSDFDQFCGSKPDLVISLRHMSILKPHVLNVPRLGVLNLHSGLLPQYRGVMATFWAMKNKEGLIGSTLHTIDDANIDTGRVVSQQTVECNYQRSYLWNTLNLYRSGCTSIVESLNSLVRDELLDTYEQQDEGVYFSFPTQTQLEGLDYALFDLNDDLLSFF